MEDNTLVITTEDGKEIRCQILFTTHSDEFNKDYVVFVDDKNVASAASYKDNGDGKGELEEIKTEEEWNYLEKLLNQYNNDDQIESCDNETENCVNCPHSGHCAEEEE